MTSLSPIIALPPEGQRIFSHEAWQAAMDRGKMMERKLRAGKFPSAVFRGMAKNPGGNPVFEATDNYGHTSRQYALHADLVLDIGHLLAYGTDKYYISDMGILRPVLDSDFPSDKAKTDKRHPLMGTFEKTFIVLTVLVIALYIIIASSGRPRGDALRYNSRTGKYAPPDPYEDAMEEYDSTLREETRQNDD